MSKATKRRTQKHRRQIKAVLKFGKDAKPRHRRKGGRTGASMHSRKPR